MDNDSERAKKLAGKKLIVTSLVEEQKEVWENTDSGRKIAKDENGMEKTQPSIFFIFEWVE